MGKGNDPNCQQVSAWEEVGTSAFYNLFALDARAAITPVPPESVSYCHQRAALALRSIREVRRFLDDQPDDERGIALRERLDRLHAAARMLAVSRPEAGEMGVHRFLFDRRLRQLAVAVTHSSQARPVAGMLKDLLLAPTFSAQEYQAAVEAHDEWVREAEAYRPGGSRRPQPLAEAVTMNPRQGPLFEIACPDPDNVTLDEALVLTWQIETVSRNMRQLADDHGGDDQAALVSSYMAPVEASISKLRMMINFAHRSAKTDSLEPTRVGWSVDDTRMLASVGALLQRHFLAGDGSMKLMAEARRVTEVCARALEEANGIPAPEASFLPTLNRAEFETVFPYHVDADRLRGAYMPKLNMVTLSPGHSRMLLDPDWTPEPEHGKLLLRVHIHELAHATANNVNASRRDPLEVALGEGYAEVVSERAIPTVSIDLSLTQGRRVKYADSQAYPAETKLVNELIGNPNNPDDPIARERLAKFAAARSMVVAAAQIIHGGDPRNDQYEILDPALMKDTRECLIAYLRGNPQPLRQRLMSSGAAAA